MAWGTSWTQPAATSRSSEPHRSDWLNAFGERFRPGPARNISVASGAGEAPRTSHLPSHSPNEAAWME